MSLLCSSYLFGGLRKMFLMTGTRGQPPLWGCGGVPVGITLLQEQGSGCLRLCGFPWLAVLGMGFPELPQFPSWRLLSGTTAICVN